MPRSSNISTQKNAKQENTAKAKQIPGPQIPAQQISTQSRSSSFGSGFIDSMVSGFGMGVGSSIARKMFEPNMSSEPQNQNPNLTVPVKPTSDDIFKKYQECIERNEPTINCEMLYNIK